MPREATTSATASEERLGSLPVVGRVTALFRPIQPAADGWVKVNPVFGEAFTSLGLDSAAGFLDLPGEVVSGHPDRHVVRLHLPGLPTAFYLKRQHVVRRKEKWRNWCAGFGWVSRCEREAAILEQLSACGLPGPRWAAVGVDGRGRAFLLVEECAGAVDLRRLLSDDNLSPERRVTLARTVGRTIAAIHDAGFNTPELSAKHILVSPGARAITLIDWQSARRGRPLGLLPRFRALAALHASLAETLASPRERLRVLRAAMTSPFLAHRQPQFHAKTACIVRFEAARIAGHRSLRDQRLAPAPVDQRLVWVAGEAVCAIPEVAAAWPKPAIAPPFYGCPPGSLPVQSPDGREAVLIRGRTVDPAGRLAAWVRGRVWRSPGVTLGRLLFHLERYGIPAPRLLAFGQRSTGCASAEWFALHTASPEPIEFVADADIAGKLGAMLRRLHDAGCSLSGNSLTVFGLHSDSACVRDVLGVRIAKADVDAELGRLLATLPPWVRGAAAAGYEGK